MADQAAMYESFMAMLREHMVMLQEQTSAQTREQTSAFLQAESAAREEWQKKQDAAFERSKAEADRQNADLRKRISELGDRIGQIVENMIGNNIVDKFKALGYEVDMCSRNVSFGTAETGYGEIDLYLQDGSIAILIEVKTNLTIPDIKEHIRRLEKFRHYADSKGDKRHLIAAVAGGVVSKGAQDFALKQGVYVIVQSGDAVEILPVPENFKAKEW